MLNGDTVLLFSSGTAENCDYLYNLCCNNYLIVYFQFSQKSRLYNVLPVIAAGGIRKSFTGTSYILAGERSSAKMIKSKAFNGNYFNVLKKALYNFFLVFDRGFFFYIFFINSFCKIGFFF